MIFSKKDKQNSEAVEVTISNRTVVRVILLVIATLMSISFVSRASHVLTLIGVSLFLALALNPAVSWVTKRLKSRSRVRATGVSYIVVLIVLSSFVWLVVPPLVKQTSSFVTEVPQIIEDFKSKDTALARTVRKYGLDEKLDDFSKEFGSKINISDTLFDTAGRIGGTIVSTITVLVLTFMMLVEGPSWLNLAWRLHPDGDREQRRKQIVKRMYRVVTGYVNGQVLIAAIASMFALVVLLIASTLMNVSVNAVALAAIVFLFGMIPMFGNTIGAALVVLVCLFSSSFLALVMAVYFIVYQQIENVTLQPYIQAKTNELTPMLVFIATLLGVGFGGVMGAFIAIPVAGCAKILVTEYVERKGLLKD